MNSKKEFLIGMIGGGLSTLLLLFILKLHYLYSGVGDLATWFSGIGTFMAVTVALKQNHINKKKNLGPYISVEEDLLYLKKHLKDIKKFGNEHRNNIYDVLSHIENMDNSENSETSPYIYMLVNEIVKKLAPIQGISGDNIEIKNNNLINLVNSYKEDGKFKFNLQDEAPFILLKVIDCADSILNEVDIELTNIATMKNIYE